MANWRILVCDNAILKAIEGGFKDSDFDRWADLPPDIRQKCVQGILEHNGMENIVFRRSFARGLWGFDSGYVNSGKSGEVKRDNYHIVACDYHRQQMVIADDWCKYLRDNT